MKAKQSTAVLGPLVSAALLLSGWATTEAYIADGKDLKVILAAQINDVQASTRHGTAAPEGTDSEVSNASVNSVRQRTRGDSSRPGLMDLLLGGAERN